MHEATSLPPGPRQSALVQGLRFAVDGGAWAERLTRDYGETLTLRMPTLGPVVVTTSPPLIKRVFTADPEVLQAGQGNRPLAVLLGPGSLLLLDGAEHLRQRRLLLPPFHGERLERYRDLIDDLADQALDRWPVGEPFALLPRMQELMLEIILRVVLGVREAERLGELRVSLRRTLALSSSAQSTYRYALRGLGAMRTWRALRRAIADSDAILFAELRRRRSEPDLAERDDILTLLVQARDEEGNGLDDKALRDQVITLLVAGHETTATGLTWAFERLLRNADALARLTGEARDGREETYADAVVAETLRLRPPIAFVSRRLRRPWELDGHLLPARAFVVPAIALTHRRADLYPDPLAFRPERFLANRPETYAWLPFGGGTRRCIGAAFATLEMKRVLHVVLRRARLEAAATRSERMTRRAVVYAPRDGGLVTLTHRSA